MKSKNSKNLIPKYVIIEVIFIILVVIAFGAYFVNVQIKATNQAPVITIKNTDNKISVKSTNDDLLKGVSATDKEDGDVTSSVIIESISKIFDNNTRTITYVAFDSNNNVAKMTREITYTDYVKPQITSPAHIYVAKGDTKEILSQIKATDVIDGDISSQVKLEINRVSKNIPGDYPVRASVTNTCGDIVTKDIVVTVIGKEANWWKRKIIIYKAFIQVTIF